MREPNRINKEVLLPPKQNTQLKARLIAAGDKVLSRPCCEKHCRLQQSLPSTLLCVHLVNGTKRPYWLLGFLSGTGQQAEVIMPTPPLLPPPNNKNNKNKQQQTQSGNFHFAKETVGNIQQCLSSFTGRSERAEERRSVRCWEGGESSTGRERSRPNKTARVCRALLLNWHKQTHAISFHLFAKSASKDLCHHSASVSLHSPAHSLAWGEKMCKTIKREWGWVI